ncbi:arylesterase [Thalassotalea mangrovi]|uniref:Arylesterase n=1 Tax=Thalassotalea mangrovi TaxID=2572245 RepID=A0A4U1B5Z4_9GAMM|nr:arylesterase [Thalassotalea mangrovi]TKB45750.1 arylesterase [Thalassotalea mangrovi]
MKKFIPWLFLLSCTFANPVLAQYSILLLGDSLSASYGMQENEGWVSILNQNLEQDQANYRLINASISGETTDGGLARLPKILATEEIDYLLIELGGNDGLRGFPPKLIKNNLLQMIELAQKKNIEVIVSEIKIPPNYGQRYNKMFNDVFIDVTRQTQSTLIPFFVEDVAVNAELMQADGIHPTKEAQPQLAKRMQALLDGVIGK